MKDFFEKLSSYNLFNYLLPGVIFMTLAEAGTSQYLTDQNLVFSLFLCYFIGLVISRVGSLVVEPIMKYFGLIKFASYENYIKASERDALIVTLSEANNMYRTFISLFFMLLLFKLYNYLSSIYPLIYDLRVLVLIFLLLLLFIFSYIKQSLYITRRVKASKEEE